MTTLFANACVRGDDSRTLGLCREYLEGMPDVVEIDLGALNLRPLSGEEVSYRMQKQAEGAWDDEIFSLSHQFAEADDIVIGAPYWDLSFPSVLKVYIERVSVCDITFHYTDDARCEGLCRAKSITYISTCGGFVQGADFGHEYIVGFATMCGIPEVRYVVAEGLDVVGANIEECLAPARAAIAKLRS